MDYETGIRLDLLAQKIDEVSKEVKFLIEKLEEAENKAKKK